MWTKKFWRAMLIGLALSLALTAVASAAPNKEKPPKPNPPGESVAKSCEDNGGSAWVKDYALVDGSYVVTIDPDKQYAIPACIDLPASVVETNWTVTLEADVGNRPRGDVLVRLERAIHDTFDFAGAETLMPQSVDDLIPNRIQTLEATLTAPPSDTLVFVAMPAHRMNWTVTKVIVTPGG